MTTDEVVEYYKNLLIMQYRDKPKARGTIDMIVRPIIMDLLPQKVRDSFDMDNAVGEQLEFIGKYVGASRTSSTPDGDITLNDNEYRMLIKLAVVKNFSGSSLKDIDDLIFEFFPGVIFVFDFGNMRMGYYIDSSIGSTNLVRSFLAQGLLPRPMGVQLSATILFNDLKGFFGFRSYRYLNPNATPLNTYEDYIYRRMLIYNYAIGSVTSIDQNLITESTNQFIVQEDGGKIRV